MDLFAIGDWILLDGYVSPISFASRPSSSIRNRTLRVEASGIRVVWESEWLRHRKRKQLEDQTMEIKAIRVEMSRVILRTSSSSENRKLCYETPGRSNLRKTRNPMDASNASGAWTAAETDAQKSPVVMRKSANAEWNAASLRSRNENSLHEMRVTVQK